jgi:hypothetical protein
MLTSQFSASCCRPRRSTRRLRHFPAVSLTAPQARCICLRLPYGAQYCHKVLILRCSAEQVSVAVMRYSGSARFESRPCHRLKHTDSGFSFPLASTEMLPQICGKLLLYHWLQLTSLSSSILRRGHVTCAVKIASLNNLRFNQDCYSYTYSFCFINGYFSRLF